MMSTCLHQLQMKLGVMLQFARIFVYCFCYNLPKNALVPLKPAQKKIESTPSLTPYRSVIWL